MNQQDALFEKLDKEYLQDLWDQISRLHVSRQVFRHLRDLVTSYPRLNQKNVVLDWIFGNYGVSMILGLRRLIDSGAGNKNALSFVRFLEKLEANPEVISRDRYRKIYSDKQRADWEFENAVGVGDILNNRINPEAVRRDIDELTKLIQPIDDFVDKYIAHRDRNRAKVKQPTEAEVDEIYPLIENKLQKYFLIFRQSHLAQALPTIQDDWYRYYAFAWDPVYEEYEKYRMDVFGENPEPPQLPWLPEIISRWDSSIQSYILIVGETSDQLYCDELAEIHNQTNLPAFTAGFELRFQYLLQNIFTIAGNELQRVYLMRRIAAFIKKDAIFEKALSVCSKMQAVSSKPDQFSSEVF